MSTVQTMLVNNVLIKTIKFIIWFVVSSTQILDNSLFLLLLLFS